MKESELDLKQWMRNTLEQQVRDNDSLANQLHTNNALLKNKINQLDTDVEVLVAGFKAQLKQDEYTALRKAMRERGINDQLYLAVCTSIHGHCKLGVELEQVIKLPKRHLIINTSPHFFHFYYFPYKYRIERHLIEADDLTAWFSWVLSMLINEFKM